jgi:hypothetical protein
MQRPEWIYPLSQNACSPGMKKERKGKKRRKVNTNFGMLFLLLFRINSVEHLLQSSSSFHVSALFPDGFGCAIHGSKRFGQLLLSFILPRLGTDCGYADWYVSKPQCPRAENELGGEERRQGPPTSWLLAGRVIGEIWSPFRPHHAG